MADRAKSRRDRVTRIGASAEPVAERRPRGKRKERDGAPGRRSMKMDAHEAAEISKRVYLTNIRGKGVGVRALKPLAAGTMVGTMPGYLYTEKEYEDLVKDKKLSEAWGIELTDEHGGEWVLNAEVLGAPNTTHPNFSKSIGHYFNEPGPKQKHMPVSWVMNHTKGAVPRIELWTNRDVPAGRELTIDYGDEYDRKWKRFAGHIPATHKIVKDPQTGEAVWENPSLAWEGSSMSSGSISSAKIAKSNAGAIRRAKEWSDDDEISSRPRGASEQKRARVRRRSRKTSAPKRTARQRRAR